jgi:hypothetical protein
VTAVTVAVAVPQPQADTIVHEPVAALAHGPPTYLRNATLRI